jgi:hypothetical protein
MSVEDGGPAAVDDVAVVAAADERLPVSSAI